MDVGKTNRQANMNDWNEKWVTIDFDDKIDPSECFQISNNGRIRKCKDAENDVLKKPITNGYETVKVRHAVSGKMTARYIHKLVAEAFLPKKPGDVVVLHKNFDKLDNHVDNLMWATREERSEHHKKNPLLQNRNYRTYTKLTENQVRLIKKKLNDPNRKTRVKILAKQFGVSEMQLWRIKSGENWGSVEALK